MEPLGVYIHWPFCLSKCPYCDFNSHVRDKVDHTRWRAALLTEIEHAAASGPHRPVTSIFFGGGTPSLMPPETAAAVLCHRIDRHDNDRRRFLGQEFVAEFDNVGLCGRIDESGQVAHEFPLGGPFQIELRRRADR